MIICATSTFTPGNLAAIEQKLAPRLQIGVLNGAQVVLEASLQRVAVDTGELARSGGTSWEWQGTVVRSFVSYWAGHAAFVEFGTGKRGMGTYPYNLPASGTPFTGAWVYDYKRQNWVGMPAQPYLRPALDIGRQGVLDAIRSALHGLV